MYVHPDPGMIAMLDNQTDLWYVRMSRPARFQRQYTSSNSTAATALMNKVVRSCQSPRDLIQQYQQPFSLYVQNKIRLASSLGSTCRSVAGSYLVIACPFSLHPRPKCVLMVCGLKSFCCPPHTWCAQQHWTFTSMTISPHMYNTTVHHGSAFELSM